MEEPWTVCRNPTCLECTRVFGHDGRDPSSWSRTRPVLRNNIFWHQVTQQVDTELGSVARNVLFAFTTCRGRALGTVERRKAKTVKTLISDLGRRNLCRKQRSCATMCTTREHNPVRRSDLWHQHTTSHHQHRKSHQATRSALNVIRRWRLLIVSDLQEEQMKERLERSPHDGRRCVLVNRLCLDVLHGSFSEGHRWSILVS